MVDETEVQTDETQAQPDAPVDDSPAAKKAAKKEHHANRIKAGHEHNVKQATKLWVGPREVTVEREATEDDVGFMEDEPSSLVKFVDTGEEQVVPDEAIQTTRSGAPPVLSH